MQILKGNNIYIRVASSDRFSNLEENNGNYEIIIDYTENYKEIVDDLIKELINFI
jgi:hypothetical protein